MTVPDLMVCSNLPRA